VQALELIAFGPPLAVVPFVDGSTIVERNCWLHSEYFVRCLNCLFGGRQCRRLDWHLASAGRGFGAEVAVARKSIT